MRKLEVTELRYVSAGDSSFDFNTLVTGIKNFLDAWKDGTEAEGTAGLKVNKLFLIPMYYDATATEFGLLFFGNKVKIFSFSDLFAGLKSA